MPHYLRSSGSFKFSWTANLTEGVDHNFTIMIYNVTSTTPRIVVQETVVIPHYFLNQCGEFVVQVSAVNRAGESEFSDSIRVSLPLLPDVQPVSDSLDHRIWKSSGQIMVQIQFEVGSFLKCNFI